MWLVLIWEQTAITSLYSINRLVFITDKESVYWAVWNKHLYKIRVNLSLRSAHTVYLCVLCGSENKERLFPYTALTDWLVFIAETESVYLRGRTGSLYIIQAMCFVLICEQTAITSLYSINWLVFITEDSVYCAVRTGSLYIIQVMCFVLIWEQTAITSLYSINWLVFIAETECLLCGTDWIFIYIIQAMCFVLIWEQTAINSLFSINWLVL